MEASHLGLPAELLPYAQTVPPPDPHPQTHTTHNALAFARTLLDHYTHTRTRTHTYAVRAVTNYQYACLKM